MKPLSEVAPGLLVIQIQIQAVCFDRNNIGNKDIKLSEGNKRVLNQR